MVWISILLISLNVLAADLLPTLLTKHVPESLRYISMDGRHAYVTKTNGVLGLVSSFRSTDFISSSSTSDFIVKGSRYKQRVAIEVIPSMHTEMSLMKNHRILVTKIGDTTTTEIGTGKSARLHLQDEWISYYDAVKKTIHIQNVLTKKKFEILLSLKSNPFYTPEVEMINSSTVVYSDINELGLAALISYNLSTSKSTIIYKATQTGTRIEVCQNTGYLAFGEFPYEGVSRGSKIMQLKVADSVNLSGYSTLYSATDQDLGNMLCELDSIYFIKTVGQDGLLGTKFTDVAKLNTATGELIFKTSLGNITQIVEMDGRVLIPHRGDLLVVEGANDLGTDTLKSNK